MKNYLVLVILCVLLRSCFTLGRGEQCGLQAGGRVCPDGRCCSPFGWCGSTKEYCGDGCQSQCSPSGESEISDILPRETFYKMLPNLENSVESCPGGDFYTYDSFVEGASNFTGFGTTGDLDTRKREIAAFLAHTSFETANEKGDLDYCDTNDDEYPCAPGERYYGRGPFQLKGNHNYGAYEKYSGLIDLLNEPDLLAIDPSISFEAAFWYWMVPQTKNKLPSSHDVMVGGWIPTQDDILSRRLPGFGLTTNVIVGEHECGKRWNANESDRIGFYKRYCEILGVDPGDNLSCDFQKPFSTNNPNNNHVQTM